MLVRAISDSLYSVMYARSRPVVMAASQATMDANARSFVVLFTIGTPVSRSYRLRWIRTIATIPTTMNSILIMNAIDVPILVASVINRSAPDTRLTQEASHITRNIGRIGLSGKPL